MFEERIGKMVVDRRGPSCFGDNYILRSAPGFTLHFRHALIQSDQLNFSNELAQTQRHPETIEALRHLGMSDHRVQSEFICLPHGVADILRNI
jgi:hypothetical protein